MLRNQHHIHHNPVPVYNPEPIPNTAQKLVVVGGVEASTVPLAQPMMPTNNNYGYGQPVYYNPSQAAGGNIPSYQPYAGSQQPPST